MSLDERGRQAAQGLRDRVAEDLSAPDMLASVQRTRTRRRLALAAPAAALAVAVAAVLTSSPRHNQGVPTGPGPSSPTSTASVAPHANGALFGDGTSSWRNPAGLVVPPIGVGSSPTWSPDGSDVAVLAGGILITDVRSGKSRTLPCTSCTGIAWSPDGRTFAAAGVDGHVLGLVDAVTGSVRPIPLSGAEAVRSLSWAPSSDRLAFLVTSPVRLQGAYRVGSDGSHQTEVLHYPTRFDSDPKGLAVLLSVGWAPTRDRIAVLSASPVHPADALTGPYELDVLDIRSDASGMNHLVHAGSCFCGGFVPDLVWSPDGTTLAVSSLDRGATVRRLDGDGATVSIRFLKGASGPLSWQPLPGGS